MTNYFVYTIKGHLRRFIMQNRKRKQLTFIVYLSIVFVLILSTMFTACVEKQELAEQIQDTTTGETDQETEENAVSLPGLPDDVAGYETWLKLNAEPIPPVAGGDPHNGTKNVYVNKDRNTIAPDGKQQFPYPDGSIVVKEAYRPNKDYIGLIAIMRKVEGSDPDNNDWEFIEYIRNQSDADFTVIASGRICWSCHARVEDMDYVFTGLD